MTFQAILGLKWQITMETKKGPWQKGEKVLQLMKHSQVRKALIPVPQGLVLGPLSFLTNDS